MKNLRVNVALVREYKKALYLRKTNFSMKEFLQEKNEILGLCADYIYNHTELGKKPSIELVLNTNYNLSKFLLSINNERIAVDDTYMKSLQVSGCLPFILENSVMILSDLTPVINTFVLDKKEADNSINVIIANGGRIDDPYFQYQKRKNELLSESLKLVSSNDYHIATNLQFNEDKQIYLSIFMPKIKVKKYHSCN